MDVALAMLGRRAYPSARVRERVARDFGADQADQVVTRLTELGVLDDVRYAEAFARDRFERAGYGSERVRNDLEARGVAPEHAAAALAAVVDASSERRCARRALERFRARRRRPRDPRGAAFRHLVGRGFSLDLVRDLLDRSL